MSINASEHFYDDDPFQGHLDVQTRLPGVSYFFLGNGLVQAAVQWAPRGEGTPLGLLVMDPERLRKKRESLTLDPESGLRTTLLRVFAGGRSDTARPDTLRVSWVDHDGVPAAEARWRWQGGEVVERFFCPDRLTPRLVRLVSISREDHSADPVALRVVTGGGRLNHLEIPLALGDTTTLCLVYDLDSKAGRLSVRVADEVVAVDPGAAGQLANRSSIQFGNDLLDSLWTRCRSQLTGSLAASGRVDASIWQYNREWVRDQSSVALGLLLMGDRDGAGRIVRRLLHEFVTPQGSTLDSSEARANDEAELDQNGVLLQALHQYVLWTGDLDLAASSWERVVAIAEYPLRPEFATPGGLLANRREYWERHQIHGIEKGFELAYQVFVSIGLAAAADLASRLGHTREATKWSKAAAALRTAVLTENGRGLVDNGVLFKRRRLDGSIQREIVPLADAHLPPIVPLAAAGSHPLDPDSAAALPIAHGFVAPESPLAAATLDQLEMLWNQDWTSGGYGRYHVASEPDSPGAWPVASVFVARAAVDAGRPETAWRVLRWLDELPGAPAGSWFEFMGPRAAPPFPQVGILPWTWAELVLLLVQHVIGVRPNLALTPAQLEVRPRLLPGLDGVSARIPFNRGTLSISLSRDRNRTTPWARVRANGQVHEVEAPSVIVPCDASEVAIEFLLPRD